ncbi:MAG: hypothetical protein FD189_1582 [Elusimicrobia bacterium]|nr:MAG: hypothetical protein FD154_1081 [Elusimicrobiota bacterium]KAF0154992.1 MAG: hypothetical protein FD189_1582 [Elusimicrobiota bacterium]
MDAGTKKLLDIGCGFRLRPNATGIDKNPLSPAQLHHDLNVFPYPLPDNEFDDISMIDVLEHLQDVVAVMEEIYRVSRPGATVYITVPHFSSHDSHTDPTHVHSFTSRSMNYFTPESPLYQDYRYGLTGKFRKISCVIGNYSGESFWKSPVRYLINKYPEKYERRFAYLYPQHSLKFTLQVIK